MKKTLLLTASMLLLIQFNACDNVDVIEEPVTPEIDFQLIEGEYLGSLRSDVTGFAVSAKVIKGSGALYRVELFETSDFKPSHNSDGVTPEVKGIFKVVGDDIEAKLNLKSDIPVCTGVYEGEGSHDEQTGKLTLNMTYDEICEGTTYIGNFTYTLTKLRN